MPSVTGHCNCSAVSVELKDGLPESTMLCHCTNCRASSGSLFATILFQPRNRVVIHGIEHVQSYRDTITDSGNVLVRSCPVFSVGENKPEQIVIRGGLFAPKTIPAPAVELYHKNFEGWEAPHGKAVVLEAMPPAART
ncbi:hypothetical protein JCM10450v2_001860 [Rhodotorula kratochvilovae]